MHEHVADHAPSPRTAPRRDYCRDEPAALLLLAAILVVWRYPLTRERHARVVTLLERRRRARATSQSTLDEHGRH